MNLTTGWNHKIFNSSEGDFTALALEIFQFQYKENTLYREFVNFTGKDLSSVRNLADIPFLPIRFFKSHTVKTGNFEAVALFESSGTTGMINSRHHLKDAGLYEESFLRGFERVYGVPADYCVIGLLPSYLERGNSSLVYMTDVLVKKSGHQCSGFYLDDLTGLSALLEQLTEKRQKIFLIGVTFALIELAQHYPVTVQDAVIVETGGMKGRGKELIREELHEILKKGFGVLSIHSEYGMTELLSQAWSVGEGIFNCPPWMRILCRDEDDPLLVKEKGRGLINVIDLANVYSCSFIATDDVCRIHDDGGFEVLGRMDGSDLRGCSMLI